MRTEAETGNLYFCGKTVKPHISPELNSYLENGNISDDDFNFWQNYFLKNSSKGIPRIWQTNPSHWLASQAVINIFSNSSRRKIFIAQEVSITIENKFLKPDLLGYIGGSGLAVIEVGSQTAKDKKNKQLNRDLTILRSAYPGTSFFGLTALYDCYNPHSPVLNVVLNLRN